ncbi:phosphatase PAP2 family protein [Candidatus Dependentiae bacterium]|nr:phosphatase PAP2 family protein [Candidatus Dependentiae bacterium]
MKFKNFFRIIIISLFFVIFIFEYSNLDIQIQNNFYDPFSKSWIINENNFILKFIFYDGLKMAIIGFGTITFFKYILSFFFNKYKNQQNIYLYLILCLAIIPLSVSSLKKISNVYRPSLLTIYGGDKPYNKPFSRITEHFNKKNQDFGKDYPAGHASGGFALVCLFFVFKKNKHKILALIFSLTIGWLMGIYQVLAGKHFISHNFVTMLIAFSFSTIIYKIFKAKSKLPVTLLIFFMVILKTETIASGANIKEIKINPHPIFNNGGKVSGVNKIMNKLHIITKVSTIKKDLLFNDGVIYDEEKIENSERNLRARRYLYNVSIDTKQVSDTEIKVNVNTYDQWSTAFGFALKKDEKGKNLIKLVFKEHNLLGLGKELKLKKDILHLNFNNQELEYNDNNFFGKRNAVLSFVYAESQYSLKKNIRVGKKFESDFDKYSYYLNLTKADSLESNDSVDNNYIEGFLSNGKIIGRWEFSARIHQFENIYKNSKIKMNYIFGGINYSTGKYIKTKGLRIFKQIDDIKLGYQLGGGIKFINPAFGANVNGAGWELNLKHIYNKDNDYIFQNYNFDYYYLKDFSNNTLDFKVQHQHFFKENFKLVNQIAFKKVHSYKTENSFTLGEDKGLRGYKSVTLEGNKFFLFNAELQYVFNKELWKIMYPGINLFYDAGRTYNQGEKFKLEHLYHDFGISFKTVMHRSSSFEEFNFSISFPFKGERKPVFSFQTNVEF